MGSVGGSYVPQDKVQWPLCKVFRPSDLVLHPASQPLQLSASIPTGFSPHTAFPLPFILCLWHPSCPRKPLTPNHLCLRMTCLLVWCPGTFTPTVSMSCHCNSNPSLSWLPVNACWVGTAVRLAHFFTVTPNRVPSTLYRTQAFVQKISHPIG